MEAEERRTATVRMRHGCMAVVALCAALAVAGCSGAAATPQTIYLTYPPSPSAAAATPTSVSTATAEATPSSPGSTATPTQVPTPSPVPTPTATPKPTPAPTATPLPVPPSVSSTTVSASATDGRWTVTFRKPVVSGALMAAEAAMNSSITTRVNAYISAFNVPEPPPVASGDSPSTLNGDYSAAYVTPGLLSLRLTVETFITGAAHPAAEAGSINFNVQTGAVIQLADLFTSPAAALPVLQAQAHAKLTALLGSDLSWPSTVTMADFGKAWVFTSGGLELTWSQGEIASMASGTPTISIPWSALSAVIARPGPAAGFAP